MRIKVKRIIAMPLIFILMFTSCLYIYPRQAEPKENSIYQGEGFEVKFYLDSVYDGGYHASKGIKLAIEQLNGLNSDNKKSILLFCSGTELDDMEEAVEMAKQFEIPVTTVNMTDGNYSSVLKSIAEETGGTYLDISGYNFSSPDDLYKIANMTLDAFSYIANREDIDTDGDGIPDMYEVLGVKAANGQILYSDPNKIDTDGDVSGYTLKKRMWTCFSI